MGFNAYKKNCTPPFTIGAWILIKQRVIIIIIILRFPHPLSSYDTLLLFVVGKFRSLLQKWLGVYRYHSGTKTMKNKSSIMVFGSRIHSATFSTCCWKTPAHLLFFIYTYENECTDILRGLPHSEDFSLLSKVAYKKFLFPSPTTFHLQFLCTSKGLHNINHAIRHLLNKK